MLTKAESTTTNSAIASPVEVSSPACHLASTPKLAQDSTASSMLRQRRRPPTMLLATDDYTTSLSKPARFKYPRVKISVKEPQQAPLKRKPSTSDDEEDDNVSDEMQKNRKPATDLDIQFQQMKLQNLTAEVRTAERRKTSALIGNKSSGQSLTQYCNFDEKKVVKVAPHIRRKDVICDTVDAWSGNRRTRPDSDLRPRYRPLIFGGTFPIDLPFDEQRQLQLQQPPKTFDIDRPTSLE